MRALSPASVELRPQIIEKQRIEHFQDVRDAGVVHPKRATLLVLRHRLDHRSEDVRVDLLPVEIADVEQIRARDLAEARHVHAARKQPAVHIRESIGPPGDARRLAVPPPWCSWRGTASQITSWVLDESRRAHLLDGASEQLPPGKMSGILGEEAEDQPRHEMVHVMAPRRQCPTPDFPSAARRRAGSSG